MRLTLPLFASLLLCGTCLAQQPILSHPHGYYDQPFQLVVNTTDDAPADAVICYTLDGSVPTSSSNRYTTPIRITGNTLFRGAYLCADTIYGNVATATYLFMDDVLRAPDVPDGYPSTWGSYIEYYGTAKGDYGMDPEVVGNATYKSRIIAGLEALPTLSIVTNRDHFFSHERDSVRGGIYIYTGPPVGDKTGRDWVRPISVELFGCGEDLTVDCGIKIHGGHSRLAEKTPKHSFRLTFKEKYGPKKLKYPLFGDEAPRKYDQLILRCMFGNTWTHWDQTQRQRSQYTRDLWARSTQQLMGHPSVRGRYVNLFINGMYWGMYIATERVNDYYCSSNFGGEKEEYDVIKVDEGLGEKVVASEGTIDRWKEMLDLAEKAATSNADYFRLIGCNDEGQRNLEARQWLEIDNFIDYMLINQYGGNNDWDKHNWLAFANRADSTQGFRMLCWDTEIIFTDQNYNALGKDKESCPSRIFNRLVKNPNFLHRYMDRAYRHLLAPDGLLTPSGVVQTWDSLYAIIRLPLWAESARWGDYRRDVHKQCNNLYLPSGEFMTERNRLTGSYFPNRSAKLISQLKEKGWYSSLAVPRIKYNGILDLLPDTVRQGDILQLQNSAYTAYYTLDGSSPILWTSAKSGKATSASLIYKNGQNLLDGIDWSADQLTLCVIRRLSSDYSPAVTWTFAIDHSSANNQSDAIDVISPDTYASDLLFNLHGHRASDSSTLSPGIYLRGKKKFLIK